LNLNIILRVSQTSPLIMLNQQAVPKIITFLIAVLPIMTLSQIGYASAAFFSLMLLSAYLCITRFEVSGVVLYLSQYRMMLLALFVSALVVLISGAHHNQVSGSDLERSLRLAAGVTVLLAAFLRVPSNLLKQAVWGVTISVWVSSGYVLWTIWTNPIEPRPDLSFIHNAVTFGNLMFLATSITAFSIMWNLTRFKRAEPFFKILTVVVGLGGVALTQTRGAWLAAPCFILIGAVLIYPRLGWRQLSVSVGLSLILLIGVFAVNPVMRERIVEGQNEVIECMSNNPLAKTSLCIRLQLWRASLITLRENILLGSGSTANFPSTLKVLAEQNLVSQFTASEFGEPHSEIMQSLSAYGLFGLVSLILVYLAPAFLFIKRLRSAIGHSERTAAAMGLALCTGFFIFGLTELMFRNMHVVSYYAALNAWLLALSDSNHLVLSRESEA